MATIALRSMNDYIKVLEAKISMALKMTQDDIYKTIQSYISDYYHEPVFSSGSSTPVIYERTYKLLNSLIKTDLKVNGNSISCTVEIDQNYLNSSYSGGVTGLQIMEWLNDAWHGGTVRGEHEYWNEALTEISGEQGVIWLMKYNLRKCELNVL